MNFQCEDGRSINIEAIGDKVMVTIQRPDNTAATAYVDSNHAEAVELGWRAARYEVDARAKGIPVEGTP